MCGLVLDEIALECGHFRLVEEWRIGSAPQIPHIVHLPRDVLPTLRTTCRLHKLVKSVEQSFTAKLLSADIHLAERTVGVQRHGGMEHQIVVAGEIH